MFPALPAEIRHARAFVLGVLGGHVLAADAALVVSELATNALLHSISGQWCGPFIVVVEETWWKVRVSVIDLGSDTTPELVALRSPDPDCEHGRGLAIVDSVAEKWGFEPVPVGLRVWAELLADHPV